MTGHASEVSRGERFEFGANWARFLEVLNDESIAEAEKSLRDMLAISNLQGKSFLDVGSGSGLFSLAARRLGAKVISFDYDPKSTACTQELKRRYFQEDPQWIVEEGSALDPDYLSRLGQFDVVYSWGVLHHTGRMWEAMENISPLVKPNGKLFISIYNDQGGKSKRWRVVKRLYCSRLPGRWLVIGVFVPYFALGGTVLDIMRLRNPFSRYLQYKKSRGMSIFHDWIDWLGGYPFEVAKPEEIFDFLHKKGFSLMRLKTCAGNLGCNEFVFTRNRVKNEEGQAT